MTEISLPHLQFFLKLNVENVEKNRSRRIRRIINLIIRSVGASLSLAFPRRRMWTKIRSSVWWEEIVLKSWDEKDFKENFRINRSTFNLICERLRPTSQTRYVRHPLSIERRVAVTLARLGSSGELRHLANLFGMARSTVCVVVGQTCTALIQQFKECIKFPQGDDLYTVTESFLGNHGLPGVCGALDGTHIPIKAPIKNAKDYFNRKRFYSVILQAIVDHKKKFININFGWPGSVHDARVLSNSQIYKVCEAGHMKRYRCTLPGTAKFIHPFLVADPAYPLKDWLMKPFSGIVIPHQQLFNAKLSSCRIYVEHAFGMLKGRWRCLLKVNDSSLKNIHSQVLACCILHNIAQDIADEYLYEWDEQDDGLSYSDPTICSNLSSTDTKDLRQHLVQWCQNNL